jgi:hypothetical protein
MATHIEPRCFVVVPTTMTELHARLVTAFVDEPHVFVLLDRRKGDRALSEVGVFAVGGGELDPALRSSVESKLRGLGVTVR